jgi:hypothetical protein
MTANRIPPRTLTCAKCGQSFGCSLGGGCWCADEPYRLPVPEEAGQDCLCPACLRRLAQEQQQQQ